MEAVSAESMEEVIFALRFALLNQVVTNRKFQKSCRVQSITVKGLLSNHFYISCGIKLLYLM